MLFGNRKLSEIGWYGFEMNFCMSNPIINNCLRHALQHLDKYKQRAVAILQFRISYNQKKANEIADCYVCNELGGLKSFKNKDYYNIIILADSGVTDDEEIKLLINQLPKFRKGNP